MRNPAVGTMLFALGAMSLWFQPNPAHAQTPEGLPALTVLVRHAERPPGEDPSLLPEGFKRGQDLATALRNLTFSAIITTHLKRTSETAQRTAEDHGQALTPIDVRGLAADDHASAVANAVRKHAGGVVLVVNHGNTLRRIISRLGGPVFANDICDNVYDHLFTLVSTSGKVHLINSRYGAASPPPQGNCM